MTRKLRVLGVSVVALLAFGAIASAAQAQIQLTSEASTPSVILSGEQTGGKHKFAAGAGNNVECNKAVFNGSSAVPASTFTATPTYTECTAFGLAATVTNEGCDYVFTPESTEKANTWTIKVSLNCAAGKFIKINAGFGQCQLRIGDEKTGGAAANQGLAHVSVSNGTDPITGKEDLTVTATVTGINYDVTTDGAFCPLSGTGEKNDGTYDGVTTVTATNTAGNARHITLSD